MLKSKEVKIVQVGDRSNRDAGRTYLLTEMPAQKAEKWAARAFMAMNRERLQVPDEVAKLGMLGFAMVGFQAFAGGDWGAVEPLMDEMLSCVQIKEEAVVRPLGAQGDIWEVSTLYTLRKELLELHVGFTFAEAALILGAKTSAEQERTSLAT